MALYYMCWLYICSLRIYYSVEARILQDHNPTNRIWLQALQSAGNTIVNHVTSIIYVEVIQSRVANSKNTNVADYLCLRSSKPVHHEVVKRVVNKQ